MGNLVAGRCSGADAKPASLSSVTCDAHTVALWLFDDPEYFNATITDAGQNWYDLRLQPGGKLVPGRFGTALALSDDRAWTAKGASQGLYKFTPHAIDATRAVTYAEMPAWNAKDWGPAPIVSPTKLFRMLAKSDWTWEFWLRLNQAPTVEADLVDVHAEAFYCGLSTQAEHLLVRARLAGLEAVFSLREGALADGRWHHLAITCSGPEKKRLNFFLDGIRQPAGPEPPKRSPATLPASQGVLTLFSPPLKDKPCEAMLDEMRVSAVARYSDNFTPPGSFSRNFGSTPPAPTKPNGPPLLFGPESSAGPPKLGARKHLFIDDALIESMQRVQLTANPPPVESYAYVEYQAAPWEDTFGAAGGGQAGIGLRCIYDHNGEIRFLVTNGAMWVDGSQPTTWNLLTSTHGLHLERPSLNLFCRVSP